MMNFDVGLRATTAPMMGVMPTRGITPHQHLQLYAGRMVRMAIRDKHQRTNIYTLTPTPNLNLGRVGIITLRFVIVRSMRKMSVARKTTITLTTIQETSPKMRRAMVEIAIKVVMQGRRSMMPAMGAIGVK